MGNVIDITGNRFGLLTVIKISGKQTCGYKLYLWECLCDCGNTIHVPKHYLTSGDTKSCGCFALKVRREMHLKHGKSKHPLFSIWSSMKQRCYDENCEAYPNYGGRGINICKRWLNSFMNFYCDMITGYEKGLTIERINNNGNYIKRNTKWLPRPEQAKNRRTAVILEHNGDKKSVTEWAKQLGVDSRLIFGRLSRGWSIEESLFLPKQKNQFSNQR